MSATTAPPIAAAKGAKPWYRQLWIQVMIGMGVGILLGWLDPDRGAAMQPLGDAFIKVIRMLIAPIIFCTVVHGIAQMHDMARVGRVAVKALIYFEVLTTIALVIGLVAVNVLRPGEGMNVDLSKVNTSLIDPYVKQTGVIGFVPFLMNIIPSTFVGAFAEGNILQVLFISIACGFALIWLGETGKPLVNLIEVAAKMIFRVVDMIMWTAPIGAFGAIAFTVGKFGS
jgi:aerobic C4-dicarboxylate transport protein